MSDLKPIPEESLKRSLFGIVKFEDLFEHWVYCKDRPAHPHDGQVTPRPRGYVFMSSDYPEKVNTWVGGSAKGGKWNISNILKGNLSVKARHHVTKKATFYCFKDGPVHYKIIPWRDTGHALIVANDSTMIPHIWVAFVPLDSIPEINSDIVEIWEGRDGSEYVPKVKGVRRYYDSNGKRETKFEVKIEQYTVSLDIDMESHGVGHPDAVTGCWINWNGYSASLQALLDNGELCGTYYEHQVPQETINKIEQWAYKHGYAGDDWKEGDDA